MLSGADPNFNTKFVIAKFILSYKCAFYNPYFNTKFVVAKSFRHA